MRPLGLRKSRFRSRALQVRKLETGGLMPARTIRVSSVFLEDFFGSSEYFADYGSHIVVR
jgi:hypothetical protein